MISSLYRGEDDIFQLYMRKRQHRKLKNMVQYKQVKTNKRDVDVNNYLNRIQNGFPTRFFPNLIFLLFILVGIMVLNTFYKTFIKFGDVRFNVCYCYY